MANQTTTENQEIDLSKVSRKMRGYLSRGNDSLFDMIMFIKRNIIILVVLIVGGYYLGKFLDGGKKVYENKVYVIPNFGSVDYLYTKVEHLQSKISEKDEVFFRQAGLVNMNTISKVEIEPVVDIYTFIEDTRNRNFEMLKLMSENGDINKIMEEDVTSKNYKHHLITITTKGTTDPDTVQPLLDYLNASDYFAVIQKEAQQHLEIRIATIDTTLKQIDAILNDLSSSGSNDRNLVYVKENTTLDEVIKLKEELIKEQGKNKVERINYTRVIKDSSIMLNAKKTTLLKMRYILPVLLTMLFVFAVLFRAFYRSQVRKRKIVVEETA